MAFSTEGRKRLSKKKQHVADPNRESNSPLASRKSFVGTSYDTTSHKNDNLTRVRHERKASIASAPTPP